MLSSVYSLKEGRGKIAFAEVSTQHVMELFQQLIMVRVIQYEPYNFCQRTTVLFLFPVESSISLSSALNHSMLERINASSNELGH